MRPMARTTMMEMEASVALLVRIVLLVVAAAMAATGIVGATARPAYAAPSIFTVDSTADTGDATPDGSCNSCTLREAIQEANANNNSADQDQIHFNIPGDGVHTISPTSAPLPVITEPVSINGYSQRPCTSNPAPCSIPNTLDKGTNAKLMIELSGDQSSDQNDFGLAFFAPNSLAKGLVINRFDDSGILLSTSSANSSVQGNFIGTNPAGTRDLGNGGDGVSIASTAGTNNTIGGNTHSAPNLISGNEGFGVDINSDDNAVVKNLIGTDKDGTSPIGNSLDGVRISSDSTGNTVEGNTIAFNGLDGVSITGSTTTGNSVLSNSIFSNVGQGIDLLGEGPTPNDPGDGDVGPNGLQNFPEISSAKTTRKATTIKGTLNSTPNKTFIVQFFSNASGDEGQKFIGQTEVTTDTIVGVASFTFKPAQKVRKGKITATATETVSENTSEFSAAKKVVVHKR